MGWNSAFVILHDQLNEIVDNPKAFVEALDNATRCGSVREADRYRITGQTQLVHCAHADSIGIIAVGGNTGDHLGYVHGVSNYATDESRIEIVKQLADRLGYRLVRKRKSK